MSPKELATIRLVSRLFESLAKPILFRSFTLRPYGSDDSASKFNSCLDFFSSPQIAPIVRLIRLYPQKQTHGSTRDGHFLVDQFFQLLPRFVYLETLYCEDMPFSSFALQQLSLLEYLVDLQLDQCPVTATDGPRVAVKVTNVGFQSSNSTPPAPIESYVRWLKFLRPESMKRLRLSLANAELAHGFLESLSTSPLPLTHLTMPHNPNTLVRTLRAMPTTAMECLIALSIQVAFVTEDLLRFISSRFHRVEDLTIMVYPNMHIPTDAYSVHVCP